MLRRLRLRLLLHVTVCFSPVNLHCRLLLLFFYLKSALLLFPTHFHQKSLLLLLIHFLFSSSNSLSLLFSRLPLLLFRIHSAFSPLLPNSSRMESKSLCVFLSILLISSSFSFCSAIKLPKLPERFKGLFRDPRPYKKGLEVIQCEGPNIDCGGPSYCATGKPANKDHCQYRFLHTSRVFLYGCDKGTKPCI